MDVVLRVMADGALGVGSGVGSGLSFPPQLHNRATVAKDDMRKNRFIMGTRREGQPPPD